VTDDLITGFIIDQRVEPPWELLQSVILAFKFNATLNFDKVLDGEVTLMEFPARRWETSMRAVSVCVDNGDGTTTSQRIIVPSSRAAT
jgi:hypothetical protein